MMNLMSISSKSLLINHVFSSSKGHTAKDTNSQLSKWQNIMTDKDVAQGLKIMKAFGFECYDDSIFPIKK